MRQVALLVETSRTYGRELLRGIQRYVAEHEPWSMYLELRGLDSKPPGWLKNWKGDGILTRTGSPELARAIQRAGVPVVELRSSHNPQKFPFVGVDNVALGTMAAQHLLERGFRHFGIYELDTETYFRVRCESFIRAIQRAGFEVQRIMAPHHQERPHVWERHRQKLIRWVRELPKPVGLMACNDQLGYWLLDACSQAKVNVPEHAAVIGGENDETLCLMANPPLTSIPYDAHRIGYAAAKLLDDMMHGKPPPVEELLIPPLHIVTRASTDTVAIDDPLVSAAIQYIRRHARRGISTEDVLRYVPLSRSTLERKIREHLGRSPREEILRIRLDAACHLLADTELSQEEIARSCGFRTVQYFCTVFRKQLKKTPGAYRKQVREA